MPPLTRAPNPRYHLNLIAFAQILGPNKVTLTVTRDVHFNLYTKEDNTTYRVIFCDSATTTDIQMHCAWNRVPST